MKKPEIILNVFSSLDGRITTAPDRNVTEWTAAGIDGDAHEVTNQLYDELECDGLISGSETLMVYGKHWIELTQPLYEPKNSKAYIVFDGQGRINWYQTEDLVVVTKENVADEYIQQLDKKGITYIKAGNGQHVDIELALQILYNMGFRKLGLSGGGTFNGVFLRQGLIDEISLVIAPLAIGGKHTPTLFDCDDLQRLDDVTKLELQNMKPIGKGSVWLHYKVR